jgi:hydrogenase expression/formation protein HypD
MKYIDEFRNKKLVENIAAKIKKIALSSKINIMEVCGTHTQSFRRFGLDKMLPFSLKLISGPGCPVCVCHQEYIDQAIALAKLKDIIILTFGDMLRVPGTRTTLEKEKSEASDVRVVYSAWDSLKIAQKNPQKKVIFLAVGFETTAPTIALTLKVAKKKKIANLFFLSGLKLIPPAMQALLRDPRIKIDGFLCPGHVSTIIGIKPYAFIPKRYKIGCCVTGFEPLDILEGIYLLLQQIINKKPGVANQYVRVVTKEGNLEAKRVMSSVFQAYDADWRGLGLIPKSGLKIKKEFARFDAEKVFPINLVTRHPLPATRCRCADILKGIISPLECPLFSKTCSPDNPLGPCMVSREGACNAYYRYK